MGRFDCVCLKGFKMEKGFRGLVCKGIHIYIYIDLSSTERINSSGIKVYSKTLSD